MPDRIYYSEEARHYAMQQRVAGAIVTFALGIGVGAVLALLFAPEPGEETRQMIADALEEGYQRGKRAANKAMDEVEDVMPGQSNEGEHVTTQRSSYRTGT